MAEISAQSLKEEYAQNRVDRTELRSSLIGCPTVLADECSAETALQGREQTGWQAWKDHDAKSVEGMTPENAVNIADGTVAKGKQQILKTMVDPGCTVNSFSLSDFSYV